MSIYDDYLAHHGIKGQKWGVRRFQNEDGSLTSAGKERYGAKGSSKSLSDEQKAKLKKAAKIAAIGVATAAAAYGAYKLGQSGAINGPTRLPQLPSPRQTSSDRQTRRERMRDAVHTNRLSDDELAIKINRIKKEMELRDLTYRQMTTSPDPIVQAEINAGRKVLETLSVGVGLYTVKSILSKKFDPREAATYVAPKPKNK